MTEAFSFNDDPYYTSRPARWLRDVIEDVHGLSIVVDDELDQTVAASREDRAVWVRPGLTLLQFHKAAGQAAMFCRWGEAAVPTFRKLTPKPWLAASHGLLIPNPGWHHPN